MTRGAAKATTTYLCGALVALSISACRGDRDDPNPNPNPNNPNNNFNCPGEGITVCDLKYESSPEHPAVSDPVALANVVVTSPLIVVSRTPDGMVTLQGFYVQDQESLAGEYSGILVIFSPMNVTTTPPTIGDVVNINGTFETFGMGSEQQKQVQAVSFEVTGRTTVEPLSVDSPSVVVEKAKAYEGVLLKLPEVAITKICTNENNCEIMPNGMPLYGFEIENKVLVSGSMYIYNNPQVGEVFSSITGVLRIGTGTFDANQYLLSPRSALDVVPKNAASVVRKIVDIQDITSAGHPLEGCTRDGGGLQGKCAVAELTNVVVTAVDAYAGGDYRALWVQDDTVADGRFAGVKVYYNPTRLDFIPERGMRVNVSGEVIDYYNNTEIQFPTIVLASQDRVDLQPIVVSPSDVARTSDPTRSPYEGVLVKLENVIVTQRCVEDTQQRDHGNWIVANNVYIGSSFDYTYNGDLRPSPANGGPICVDGDNNPTGLCACDEMTRPNDQRMDGDTFTSLVGIGDYGFNEFKLEPRDDADLVR